MRILYLDCSMGAAGDMLTAALIGLVDDPDGVINELNALNIPKVRFEKSTAVKCGISGTAVSVKIDGVEEGEHEHHHEHEHEHHHEHEHEHHHEHEHEHHHEHEHEHHHEHEHEHHHHSHTSMSNIEQIVAALNIPDRVKEHIIAVYGLIAKAESTAHGVSVDMIHFHEVGNLDAIADITAVCLLMDRIGADRIICSPIHVGYGTVECAHGVLPVPAPATAYILKGAPIYGGSIEGELCTPTGAALIRHYADDFGGMPLMTVEKIGYGMGKRDHPAANCLRAMLGESADNNSNEIAELSCNVDDMTAEEIGFAVGELLKAGAKDVYTLPAGMKKCRPGTVINVLCDTADREKMAKLIFKHTSTIGIRENICRRYVLSRTSDTAHTKYGDVGVKLSSGYGVQWVKYEYDDLARLAEEHGVSVGEVRRAAEDSRK